MELKKDPLQGRQTGGGGVVATPPELWMAG